MPFKKNTAITGFPFALVGTATGAAITSGTPVGYYLLDGGTQGTVAGTPVHEGNGQWSVNLLAAEMNGDVVGLYFTHGSAIPTHFTIKTETKLVSELQDVAATAIVSSGAITTSGGTVILVGTVNTLASAANQAIRTEMDSNSTKLANLDATITSRLGTAAYTTPPTVTAIRTEMDSNSTKLANLDATTSSRLASSSYTAPDNADIVLIKAKTDNLPATPAATSDIPSANTVADAVLSRGVSNVESSADTTSLAAVILATLESSVSGTSWTIRKTTGGTFVVKTLTTDAAAVPVIGVT